jgi:Mn2+/Fe2+ NRAMP family transporter
MADQHTTNDTTNEETGRDGLLAALGPGLLWAGTAVGVSHLVQSTRAGAGYGMSLLLVILTANLLKYPAFEAAPRYTASTGKSLLQAYREQGRWALILFLCLTIGTMFTVLGAVTIVTAGMASLLISDGLDATQWSAILLVGAGVLLASGKFKALEGLMKILMLVLTASTIVAIALLIGKVDFGAIPWGPPLPELSEANIFFMVALVGWMPSAIDISVWQSLWSLEKARTEKKKLTVAGSDFDFKVGYFGTVILAICFVFMGAGVLHGSGEALPNGAGAFAAKFVGMYVEVLGEWARPVVMIAAFSTMLSTTVTVSDGFPRALEAAIARLGSDEEEMGERSYVYWGSLVVVGGGALVIISEFAKDLKALVDLATTLSFLTAPVLAWLNFRAVNSERVPEERRPKGAFRVLHICGIVFTGLLALYFLYIKANASA